MSMLSSTSLICFGCLLVAAHANVFLGRKPNQASPAPLALLDDLERVMGKDHRDATERRVRQLEELIRPTFQALPKGTDGGVGPEGVRYALHRLFVDRHGWFVRGLHAVGESYNSSSPAAIFQQLEDSDLHNFFEERLGSHGFSLHHVAVMAGTLEALVRNETVERLATSYKVLNLSRTEDITEEQELEAIDMYMMIYVLGLNNSAVTESLMDKYRKVINQVYPTWEETRNWVREVRTEVLAADGTPGARTFSATDRVLEAMEDRYGRWQNRECQDLKDSLLEMEQVGTGRVPIERFYKSALDGNWQFSESPEYLRLLGALDDADSSHMSVIIPNYINSHSNCVASSSFYSVCCIDECQSLIRHIETEVAAPEASPERIVELVASLPSATIKARPTLPASLTKRLEDIASHHGGAVPLHGRLFMQWMHHAYPRECSYPHISGTTKPLSPFDWMKATGQETKADTETMQWHVDEAGKRPPQASRETEGEDDGGELPWLQEEELFVTRPKAQPELEYHGSYRSAMRGLMLLAAIFSVVMTLSRTFFNTATLLDGTSKQKFTI